MPKSHGNTEFLRNYFAHIGTWPHASGRLKKSRSLTDQLCFTSSGSSADQQSCSCKPTRAPVFTGDFGFQKALQDVKNDVLHAEDYNLADVFADGKILTDFNTFDVDKWMKEQDRPSSEDPQIMQSRCYERVLNQYNQPAFITPSPSFIIDTCHSDYELDSHILRDKLGEVNNKSRCGNILEVIECDTEDDHSSKENS